MPSFLIPSDLDWMIPPEYPPDVVPVEWAEQNLLASPGAIAMKDGNKFRIPTLVPAVKADGSCIHLNSENRCTIHEIAPFGCAYFDCGPERGHLSRFGLQEVMRAWNENGLYARIWQHLYRTRHRQQGPEVLRARMAAGMP